MTDYTFWFDHSWPAVCWTAGGNAYKANIKHQKLFNRVLLAEVDDYAFVHIGYDKRREDLPAGVHQEITEFVRVNLAEAVEKHNAEQRARNKAERARKASIVRTRMARHEFWKTIAHAASDNDLLDLTDLALRRRYLPDDFGTFALDETVAEAA